jgi:type VI secretion system secreted protein Hcp
MHMNARKLGCLVLALAMLASVPSAFAELNAYLTVKGQKQGDIKGSVVQKGRENSIMVIAVSHEVVSPRDAASGLPTGKRQHKPFVITKEVDRASPQLYTALANNENLTRVELRFWMPSGTGAEIQYFTVRLTNANIASIRSVMLNNKVPENMQMRYREEIAFTYQKIEWIWNDGGITASDDWESPAP